jgi:hypothetical protein
VSAVSVTVASPCAGTVTVLAPTANMPSGAVVVSDRLSVAALPPPLT